MFVWGRPVVGVPVINQQHITCLSNSKGCRARECGQADLEDGLLEEGLDGGGSRTMLPYRIAPFPDSSAAKNRGFGGRKSRKKKSSQNGVCLVWKMFLHPWRVFLYYLEVRSAHISKKKTCFVLCVFLSKIN